MLGEAVGEFDGQVTGSVRILLDEGVETLAYKIDLTRIEGNGDFACPRCGAILSPNDETEAVYSILGSRVNGDCWEEVVIRCNKCSSHIHLTGFSLLQEIETSK